MKNKFLSVLCMLFVTILLVTNVQAADSMFHMGMYSDIYKLSEQADIELPFINMFTNAATYDKDVKHSGISVGQTTIDVNEKLEGMQVLVSTDMITIKGEIENSFIYANNVVIEGRITGDTIIFAPTVQILEGATVEKDVIVVANNLDIIGTVEGNIIATISDMVKIKGTINKDLRIIAKDILLENETIKGDVYVETKSDTSKIKEKYPEATVKKLTEEGNKIDWMSIITKGIVTVVVYSAICFLITRKENNIVIKAYDKFKEHTVYGLLTSFLLIILLLILPIILIILAVVGLEIIAWPLLTIYLSLILITATMSMLIVGTIMFEVIKVKVGKFKIPTIALIFILLYTLSNITILASYVQMAIFIIALAIVVTMLTKKTKSVEEQKANK